MRHWFYLTESQRRVAIPEADFVPLAEAGVIVPETMVWTEGMDEWMSAGEIHPELFGDATAMAPVDVPTVLQMVRSLSAPMGRASSVLKTGAIFLILTAGAILGFLIFATSLAVEQFGGSGWLVLCGLPVAAVPALLAAPILTAARASQVAHSQLDRAAFYEKSRALGRLTWIGSILAGIILVVVLAGIVLSILYRVEILEFIRGGRG